jgi:hypothetical protein
MIFRYWDVGESPSGHLPNLGKASTARVMQAILITGSQLSDHCVDGGQYDSASIRPVSYRVAVPIGSEKQFESISGYRLEEPSVVSGQ